MGLDLEQMDAEPAAPEPPVTPPEPQATPPAPPIAEPVVAPASSVTPVVTPEPKHDLIPLAKYLDEKAAYKARIAELEAEKAARASPPDPVPDFMEDPKGYVDKTIQAAATKAEANEKELQSLREQNQIQSLISEAGQAEVVFAKDHPDYEAALDHVRSTRMAQLRLMDGEATEAQLKQVIAREEIMGIAAAKQRGISPAELAYKYAQTLGYKPPVAAPAVPATPVATPTPPVPPTPPTDVSAARSLGAGGGGGSAGDEEEESELTSALKARFRR